MVFNLDIYKQKYKNIFSNELKILKSLTYYIDEWQIYIMI